MNEEWMIAKLSMIIEDLAKIQRQVIDIEKVANPRVERKSIIEKLNIQTTRINDILTDIRE